MKDVLAVVQTPYHLIQLQNFFSSEKSYRLNTILYSNFISENELESTFPCNLFIKLPDTSFQFAGLKTLKKIFEYRKKVKVILKFIELLDIEKYSSVVIFTDKDYFNQILIDNISKGVELIAIDEGIGFYSINRNDFSIYKLLYPFISKVLFGQKYYYISRLGEHTRIDRLLLRYPHFLDGIGIKAEHLKISKKRVSFNENSKKIMILTSPMVEDLYMESSAYINIIFDLVQFWESRTFNVYLKRHPREKILLPFEISSLDSTKPVESLDLSDFRYVINFGSSAVLDILSQGFPKERLITIDVANFGSLTPVFQNTCYYSSLEEFLNAA